MSAFLGVESSATGRRWLGPTAEAERQAEAIAQATALPLPLARVLAARGVAPEEAVRFLDPQLRELLPDPRSLKDMGLAAARFVTALK
ncbi:MAG: single-stranded-DNA-specific exonuclease RecJ, partial [Albidovulum sp.]